VDVQGNLKLPEAGKAIDRRVKELLASHKVLLFMKGSPDAPRCGFSSKSVDALKAAGVEFQHFDILQVGSYLQLDLLSAICS
jgi:glutaredoxin-related protein